jgi:ubiquinone/menaquinone biosynthesis C-methylase UbiE
VIVVRRPNFIARQAGHPSGLLGRALGAVMAIETRALNDEVLRRLAIAPGEHILEIGFGHGRTLERAALAHADAQFAGVDHATDMVEALGRRARPLIEAGRLDVRAAASDLLPWPDSSFDAAYAVHTIYFWKHPERDLAEIRRVLRPEGRLLLGFHERTPAVEAALPAEVYTHRSASEVEGLVSTAGFSSALFPGPASGLWVLEARAAGRN